jgi:hypothetical protein
VVELLSSVGTLAARQIDAAGASVPITLPANTSGNGTTSVATGAAGTFIATDGDLLRVDADHVARKVPDLSPGDGRRPLALGQDGSIWLADDLGIERVVPGAPPRLFASPLKLFKEPAGFKPAGLAVATSNNAWLAVSQDGAPKRERLLRFSPSGQVSELVLGTPPSASATVLSGTDGDLQAGALARGVRTSLKVRVRCSAACSVRVAARDGYASSGQLIYARKTATLARAGVRTVTLRATRHASRKASKNAFRLEAVLTDRSGYVRKTVAARGAGALIPRR